MSAAAGVWPRWHAGMLALLLMISSANATSAQAVTVSVVGDALRVQARALGLLEGVVLNRLKEGRSVRVDFELTVLAKPDGPVIRQVQQGFALSFDLWEERFAVTRVGTPSRAVSHLGAGNAENWCLENLAIPVSALARHGLGEPFWLRLAYRVQDLAPSSEDVTSERFTLSGLIDRLSRRDEAGNLEKTIEAGPVRLSK